jgi:hypothetical protein
MADYIPVAPNNDEARKHNQSLPGQGGVFNYVNLHSYHYAGNNPVKYVDPTGRQVVETAVEVLQGIMPIIEEYGQQIIDGIITVGIALAIGLVAGTTAKNKDPFPENRHIPAGSRQQSPMGKGANAGPMELPEGPNINGSGSKGKGKAFIAVALAVLARIWDNITNSASSPPPEPSEKVPENNNPPSPGEPSFLPDNRHKNTGETYKTPPPITE